jgi:hypothetical protein
VNSENTQLGLAAATEVEHQSFAFTRPFATLLYKTSPIGETSPSLPPVTDYFSAPYDWLRDCLSMIRVSIQRGQMLKIQRAANGEVLFTLSGRMDAENVVELKTLLGSEAKGRRIVLDLKDLTLVDRDAVSFLERCEADSIKIKNCPAYIREWIKRERRGSGSSG